MQSGLLVVLLVIAALWAFCSLTLALSLRHDHGARWRRSSTRRVNAAGRAMLR